MPIFRIFQRQIYYAPNERAPRKLLLHMKQLRKWDMKVAKDGLTIVPLAIYFNAKNLAKVEIALARGKNIHDKRESLKKKMLKEKLKQL